MKSPALKNLFGICFIGLVLLMSAPFAQAAGKAGQDGKQRDEPRVIVHRFFTLVHRGDYEDAYNQFSDSVKRELSYGNFVSGAGDVKYLKLLEINVLDMEDNLIKMKVRAKIRLVYKGSLYEALYEGRVSLYLQDNQWKVMTVELEAKDQKLIEGEADEKQPQKLDFGTT